MTAISRAMALRIDIEKLFDFISKEFYRIRTYWFSALENSIERSNKTYRFLDRLRYIPRTKVYGGRLTKRSANHYDSAIKTDAGIALATTMTELSLQRAADYYIIVAGDPEYIPAIRIIQRNGGIVRLITSLNFGDLKPHPELIKSVDEHVELDEGLLQDFEYVQDQNYYDEDDDDEELEIIDEEGELSSRTTKNESDMSDTSDLETQIEE